MNKFEQFLSKRTAGEMTLLAIVAAIMIFVAGINVGEFAAVVTGAA